MISHCILQRFFKPVHAASASHSITKFKETIFIFAKYDAHHVVSFPAIKYYLQLANIKQFYLFFTWVSNLVAHTEVGT
jgi:hypothetical protein